MRLFRFLVGWWGLVPATRHREISLSATLATEISLTGVFDQEISLTGVVEDL